MLLPSFILISVVLVGNWIAVSDAASYKYDPSRKKSRCGSPVLRKCACLTVNPCEVDSSSVNPEAKIVTANVIRNNIRPGIPTEVNLSGQGFVGIDDIAFDEFTNLTSVILANNKISKIPPFVFSKLKNLEHLSVAHNDITDTKNAFGGLTNLKTLDISANPLTPNLQDNCFYGLTESCDILIHGVEGIEKIGTNAFGTESVPPVEDLPSKPSDDADSKPKSIQPRSAPQYWGSSSDDKSKNFRAQICIQENMVKRLDILKTDSDRGSDCKEIKFKHRTLYLNDLEISGFKEGWYHLKDEDVPSMLSAVNLGGNNIARVTGIAKVLPKYMTWMDLNNNKIERLEEGCFEHEFIFSLDLQNNLISEIEDNALKMPTLYELYLSNNRLKNTKFALTLPTSLVSLNLDGNEITEISENSLSNLNSLSYLNLGNNRITTLRSNFLHGASSMNQLLMSSNNIAIIEPDAFQGFTGFQIFLDNNNISSIERKSFSGLEVLQQLNVDANKLTKIERGTLNFPNMRLLQMSKNNITVIEKGAMTRLSKLEKLDISKNPMKKLENGALFGMDKTQGAFVDVSDTPIEMIQGGLFDQV